MRWVTLPIQRRGRRPDDSNDEGGRPAPGAGQLPPRPAAGARGPGPAFQGLIALVVYVALFTAGFGQALFAGGLNVPKVGQDWVDPNLFIWLWRWWPYAVTHGLDPLYSHNIGAPVGFNLGAWTTTTPAVALLVWPVTATLGAAASFNLTLLLAPPTAAWAAFVVGRRLTGRFWAALLGGSIYGFNIYELAHDVSGQPNVTVTLLFPFLAYLVLLWWDGTLGRAGFVIWLAVVLALEFYVFTEGFFDVTIVIAAALVIGFAVAGRAVRPVLTRLAGLVAVSYVGAGVLASPYLLDELLNLPTGLNRNSPIYSMPLDSLVVPRPDRLWGLPALAGFSQAHPGGAYIGIPLLVLLILFAVLAWSSKLTRLLVVTFVVIIALAVGTQVVVAGQAVFSVPWARLWSLPIASSVETARFILFGYLVLAVVMALWLAAPVSSRLRLAARWGLAVLALAAIFANLPTFAEVTFPRTPPSYQPAVPSQPAADTLPAFITQGLYRHYLKRGETVVVLSHRGNASMLFQAEAGFYFNVADGFINASLNANYGVPTPLAALSHPTPAQKQDFFNFVRSSNVSAVIVERAWSEKWMYIFGTLGLPATTVGGVTIYRTSVGQAGGLPGLHLGLACRATCDPARRSSCRSLTATENHETYLAELIARLHAVTELGRP